jgi:hypothetical protein
MYRADRDNEVTKRGQYREKLAHFPKKVLRGRDRTEAAWAATSLLMGKRSDSVTIMAQLYLGRVSLTDVACALYCHSPVITSWSSATSMFDVCVALISVAVINRESQILLLLLRFRNYFRPVQSAVSSMVALTFALVEVF